MEYRFLEERCHQRIDHHMATLQALLVRDREISIPGVDPNTPVLAMHSIAYNRRRARCLSLAPPIPTDTFNSSWSGGRCARRQAATTFEVSQTSKVWLRRKGTDP